MIAYIDNLDWRSFFGLFFKMRSKKKLTTKEMMDVSVLSLHSTNDIDL